MSRCAPCPSSRVLLTRKSGRREYVRVVLTTDAAGAIVAEKYGVEGAGGFDLVDANAGLCRTARGR